MNRKETCILLFTIFSFCLQAQIDYPDEKVKINKIKKDATCVYGEGIAETAEEALAIAEKNLESEIRRVISQEESLQDATSVIVGHIRKNAAQIKLKRGTMERIFLYAKKENILPGHQIMEVFLDSAQEPEIEVEGEEETSEEFVEEFTENSRREAEQKEKTEKSVSEASATKLSKTPEPSPLPEKTPQIISDILLASDVKTLQTYLEGQKRAHKVMYGKLGTEISPEHYIIAFQGNEIKAVFDRGFSTRRNLLNGKNEPVSNYSNCTKIWLIVYE
jgi:hypothetical protein